VVAQFESASIAKTISEGKIVKLWFYDPRMLFFQNDSGSSPLIFRLAGISLRRNIKTVNPR
jgi:hypothetical protein